MDSVMTGDVLFFANNAPTGFLLRTFTSSPWNHIGIAVRIGPSGITVDRRGVLHVLEINTEERLDAISGEMSVGAAVTELTRSKNLYNTIAVRRLAPRWRDAGLASRTLAFAKFYRGVRFTSSSLPFLSVWLGIDLSDAPASADDHPEEMFCSELVARYYTECLAVPLKDLLGNPTSVPPTRLFNPKETNSIRGSRFEVGKVAWEAARGGFRDAGCEDSTLYPRAQSERSLDTQRQTLTSPAQQGAVDFSGFYGNAEDPEPPGDPHLYTPNHFTVALTPKAAIFDGPESIVYTAPADIGVSLFQPLIIALVAMVLVGMTIPTNSKKSES